MTCKILQGKYAEKLEKENKELKEEKRKVIEYIKYNLKSFIYSKEYKDLMEILGDIENE